MIKQIKDLSEATIDDLNDNCQFVMDDSNDKTKKVSFNVLKQTINTDKAEILNILYPVGSVYFGTGDVCPLQSLISGSTWEKIGSKVITDIGSEIRLSGTAGCRGNGSAVKAKIPSMSKNHVIAVNKTTGNLYISEAGSDLKITDNPTKSGIVCDLSTAEVTGSVTHTDISINIWKRTE